MFKMLTPITSKTLTIRQKITNYLEDSLEQPGQDRGAGQPGQDSQDRVYRSGRIEQDGQNITARTGQGDRIA
jgi:hypothetical protein